MTVPACVYLTSFWGRKFQPGLPERKAFSNYDSHGKLKSGLPWKPGKARLNQALNFTFRFPKGGKTGSTMFYQAYQAFNQT